MGLTVYGGGGKPEEEKTVTAGTSVIEVLPSSGKAMKKVTVNPTPTESKSVTPTTSELTVTPSEGKHLSQVVVGAVEDVTPEVTAQTPLVTQILEGLVGKAQGANITPETVLKGFMGYCGQELVEGTFEPVDVAALFGYTKYAVDKFTLSSNAYEEFTVPHSLGVKPAFVYISGDAGNGNEIITAIHRYAQFNGDSTFSTPYFCMTGKIGNGNTQHGSTVGNSPIDSSAKEVGCYADEYYYFKAGIEYTLITMA